MNLANMNENELVLLNSLIDKELLKRQLALLSIEEIKELKIKVNNKYKPLKIEKIENTTSTFYVEGDDIRTYSNIVENEMKKYGDGGIDYYGNHQYDCFIYVFFNDEDAVCCQDNIDSLINRLTQKIYKK